MATPIEFMLSDIQEKYAEITSSPDFDRLYTNDSKYGHMFSVLHKSLNEHFKAINERRRTTHHYWAENSRDLLCLIDDLKQDLHDLKQAGIAVSFNEKYQSALERCRPWLEMSGGSTVPDGFEEIEIIRYEPVFTLSSEVLALKDHRDMVKMKMVGAGSYAHVYSYIDPEYDKHFALKRAKPGISDRDLSRFHQEFEVMKNLSFPYVLEVYRYNDERNEYRMEYCDETIRNFIKKRNAILTFSTRKRIALQLLYGLNYIHKENYLHRDISLQNILVKTYGSGAVIVKLSDFGLVKDVASNFTLTHTEMRGTIRDPQLERFKDYNVVNEIYAIGWVLHFIFTGRESLSHGDEAIDTIVKKCTDRDIEQRYASVLELIADVEAIEVEPTSTPA